MKDGLFVFEMENILYLNEPYLILRKFYLIRRRALKYKYMHVCMCVNIHIYLYLRFINTLSCDQITSIKIPNKPLPVS